MSGHSHWAGIKHKKGLNDAKKGKVFTKHAKMISIAARDGGGGKPESNFQLRLAIDRARLDNMPKENIDRAIKKGTGELAGEEIAEITYEAMGPNGIMMLIKTATDNRNRTVSEIKSTLTKNGGKMGEIGSAMWNFEQVGSIVVSAAGRDIDEIDLLAIDAGAKDTHLEETSLLVFTDPTELQTVQENLIKQNLQIIDSGLIYIPKATVELDAETKIDYENLLEALDDQDDVQDIYDNVSQKEQ